MMAARAFSLIELLVVISILALLAAMTMTAIPMVRESAARTVCAGNLRQIGVVALLYADDWEAEFPPQNPNPNFWSSPSLYSVRQGIGLLMDGVRSEGGDGAGRIFFCPGSLSTANSLLMYNRTQVADRDWNACMRYGYTYHAGLRDTQGNWTDAPFGYPDQQLGGVTTTFKANERILMATNRVIAVDGRSRSPALAVLAADWICKFGSGGMANTAANHPAGGPPSAGRGGANAVHGDGHVEWYAYQRDTLDDWWVSYALWKTDYVLQ